MSIIIKLTYKSGNMILSNEIDGSDWWSIVDIASTWVT